MVIVCWAVKGGSGTSVTAACLALAVARGERRATLLVDLAGDVPAVLGVDVPANAGVFDWLRTQDEPAANPPGNPADLEVAVDEYLSVLPRGSGSPGAVPAFSAGILMDHLAADGRPVVIDAGTLSPGENHGVIDGILTGADRSVLVTRSCYLALRRVTRSGRRIDGVVLVAEPGRALGAADVTAVSGAPVIATVAVEPQIARIVDAGLLSARVPRVVDRALAAVWEG